MKLKSIILLLLLLALAVPGWGAPADNILWEPGNIITWEATSAMSWEGTSSTNNHMLEIYLLLLSMADGTYSGSAMALIETIHEVQNARG